MFFKRALVSRFSLAATLGAALMVALASPAAASNTVYIQTNLVSDQPGVAQLQDPHLANAWGLTRSATSPWWVANNATDSSTLYRMTNGVVSKVALNVEVDGAPTGTVFNGTTDFRVSNSAGTPPQGARFIFATESGSILGWNPTTCPIACPGYSNPEGASFKGLAIGAVGTANYLYATNFKTSSVDVFDAQYHLATLAGSFTDPDMHAGFAPFGIANLGGLLYVSYAKRGADGDDVAGPANGFVDVYDTSGNFVRRAATRGRLNSPWGMAFAPASFGQFGGDLLVGNFGDGRINAIDPVTGDFVGQLRDASNRPITIDGLWALAFGAGDATGSGSADALFFTAGPDDEQHGLFGEITTTG